LVESVTLMVVLSLKMMVLSPSTLLLNCQNKTPVLFKEISERAFLSLNVTN